MDNRCFITENTGAEKISMLWSAGIFVAYSDVVIESYDNVREKFVMATFNNETETGIITMEGNHDSTTKTITYECQTTSHLHANIIPGTVMKIRSSMTFIDKGHFKI